MVGMIKTQTVSTESPVKRLMTPQGVLTDLGVMDRDCGDFSAL